MAGLHAQELDRSILRLGWRADYARARSTSDRPRRRRRCPAQARPGPPRPRSRFGAPARGLERVDARARAAPRAPTSGCSPEPWAAPSGWRSPGISTSRSPSKKTSVASSRCPPVTTTAAGPSAWIGARELLGARLGPRPASTARLGQVRRDDGGARQELVAQRVAGVVVEQRARRSRRPSPGRARPARPGTSSSASTTASIVSTSPSIPIFTASTPMSSATARTCSTIASGRHRVDGAHPDRVLGRDRGDRGHAVHAAARERLQVGLDAGAAAGVGAGDREQARRGRVASIGAAA